MATISDVAQKAGVSKTTVSRTLSGDPTLVITKQTRAKVLNAANKLGYQPASQKYSLAGLKIAVIHKDTHFLNQIDNAFYFSVRSGIESSCNKEVISYSFLALSRISSIDKELDGVLIVGNFPKADIDTICSLLPTKNVVFVGEYNFYRAKFDWIGCNMGYVVDLALKALVDSGHKNIMYLGGRVIEGYPSAFQKQFHFKAFLARTPQLTCTELLECEHCASGGYDGMKAWLKSGKRPPEAIFISNDPIAIGALRALGEFGINVPEDVSLISLNGDSSTEFTNPPLSTVDIKTFAMGCEAVAVLCVRIKNPDSITKKIELNPSLIIRKSIKER